MLMKVNDPQTIGARAKTKKKKKQTFNVTLQMNIGYTIFLLRWRFHFEF